MLINPNLVLMRIRKYVKEVRISPRKDSNFTNRLLVSICIYIRNVEIIRFYNFNDIVNHSILNSILIEKNLPLLKQLKKLTFKNCNISDKRQSMSCSEQIIGNCLTKVENILYLNIQGTFLLSQQKHNTYY